LSAEPEAAGAQRKRSILSRIVRRIIIGIYHWKGWKIDGHLPTDIRKFVIAGAPHTSNWDFVFFTGATHEEGVQPSFMGKHTLFKGIMKDFMYDMGGIPIDRTQRANYVDQVAEVFARRDELALVVAAEGSRTTDGTWKSGFYHIAQAANVPIVPAYADNDRMVVGFGPPIMPSGDYGADLLKIANWFRLKLPQLERFKALEAQAHRIIGEKSDG